MNPEEDAKKAPRRLNPSPQSALESSRTSSQRALLDEAKKRTLDGNHAASNEKKKRRRRDPLERCLGSEYEPRSFDVICAKGNEAREHTGNRRFRLMIDMNLERYRAAKSKVSKSAIVTEIIDAIQKASPEGGFIKMSKGAWYQVGDHHAREKIGQSFRDRLHSDYKSSSRAKTKRRRMNEEDEEWDQLVRETASSAGETETEADAERGLLVAKMGDGEVSSVENSISSGAEEAEPNRKLPPVKSHRSVLHGVEDEQQRQSVDGISQVDPIVAEPTFQRHTSLGAVDSTQRTRQGSGAASPPITAAGLVPIHGAFLSPDSRADSNVSAYPNHGDEYHASDVVRRGEQEISSSGVDAWDALLLRMQQDEFLRLQEDEKDESN